MAKRDSLDKIQSYIDAVQKDEITISPLFFRDYTCPPKCGGCCPKFSLDYFEGERWESFKKNYPHLVHKFKLRVVKGANVYTNFQEENKDFKCEFLNKENGRCGVHLSNPFSCEFELNKFTVREGKTYLINKLFGRGWNMMRVDGKRGALCEMKPFNLSKYRRDIELLKELKSIINSYKLKAPVFEKLIKFLDNTSSPINEKVTISLKKTNEQINLL